MGYLKVVRPFSRLLSGDIDWLINWLSLILGIRDTVPRPKILHSKISPTVARNPNFDVKSCPIKVLVFSHNLNLEGASISLKELVLGFLQRDEFVLSVVAFEDGPLRSEYESHGIFVKILPNIIHEISTIKRLDSEVGYLARLMRDTKTDLVFANTLLNFPAILAAEEAGVPSVWNPRESEPWDSYFRFLPDPVAQKAIAAIGLPRRVIFVAHATRKIWEKFNQNQTFLVIHNGINLNRFPLRGNPSQRLHCRTTLGLVINQIAVLCVGTLCDRKGQLDLVEAYAAMPDTVSSRVVVFLVGDANSRYATKLKKKCRSLPTTKRHGIRLLDPTEAIADFYTAADVFVLSSKVESFPRVVLEAMAFGLPVISTPVYGVVEQVVEGENALFYNPGDSRHLAAQIERLVTDDKLRLEMGKSSSNRISQMTTYGEMIDAYSKACLEAVL